jgi:glycosyltransferase involved in cell wall biosynthesis
MPEITILLASYKPKPSFLSQQIRSICDKDDCKEVSILIRDDDSQDETPQLLQELAGEYSNIQLVTNDLGRLGAKGNFARLFSIAHQHQVDHILFADQDDVWMSDKIAQSFNFMQIMEAQYTIDTPLLVYSDMSVVDQDLQTIEPSFMTYMKMNHEKPNVLQVLLAQNFVTGCAMMFNRALMNIAYPIPEEALMHDWWLALCAAVFGHIGYIDKPLVKYRQHGNNEVGAKHITDFFNPLTGKWKHRWLEGRENLFQSMKQAEALANRIRQHDPDNKNLPLVEAYASLQYDSPMQRVRKIKKLKVHAQSNMRQALLLSRLLFTPKVDKHG